MSQFDGFIQNQIKNPTRSLVMLDKLAATDVSKEEILVTDGAGNVEPATSASVRSEIQGICNQDIAAAEALTQVPAIEISENDTWIGHTTNNSDAADNYQRMVLTNSKEVNNTGTDDPDGVVVQVEPFGPAADKKAVFKFV